ncbi:hypothetical protein DFJ74DRAFT_696719 [Hyaloraphidium curvatum]|nr:hypothetical protein DFJ74DRAFT_696719 [Hyaloraphidium curvatum]
MAEEPLFGGFQGASRRDKLLENVVSGVTIAFVGITVLFCIVNTGKAAAHFFLGIVLALLASCEVQLVRWYRLGDLDPKFKWLILGLGASLIMLAGIANAYVWAPAYPSGVAGCGGPPNPDLHGALGLYDTASAECFLKCDGGFLLDKSVAAPGACVPKPPANCTMLDRR